MCTPFYNWDAAVLTSNHSHSNYMLFSWPDLLIKDGFAVFSSSILWNVQNNRNVFLSERGTERKRETKVQYSPQKFDGLKFPRLGRHRQAMQVQALPSHSLKCKHESRAPQSPLWQACENVCGHVAARCHLIGEMESTVTSGSHSMRKSLWWTKPNRFTYQANIDW